MTQGLLMNPKAACSFSKFVILFKLLGGLTLQHLASPRGRYLMSKLLPIGACVEANRL